jgi:hypothetical protein
MEESFGLSMQRDAELFPNPGSSTVTLRFEIAQAGQVQVRIIDQLGNTLETQTWEMDAVGLHEMEHDISALKPGVYFYEITAGGKATRKRFVKY